jgi:WD40 repeat protein
MEHGGGVLAVAFSPDGTQVATGSYDEAARLWEASYGGEVARMEHGSPVLAVAFNPDGTQLATGSSYKTALLWTVSMESR